MLPRKKPRGREAAKRLVVLKGPANVEGEKIEFEDAKLTKLYNRSAKIIRYITLEELSKMLRGGRE
jgi:ribosomal protein L13